MHAKQPIQSIRLCILIPAVLYSVANAAGDTTPSSDAALHHERANYLRLGVGLSYSTDLTLNRTIAPDAVFISPPPTRIKAATENDSTISASIGRELTRTISVELEYRYLDLGISGLTPENGFDPGTGGTPSSVPLQDASIETHVGLINLVVSPWQFEHGIDPFLSIGAGAADLSWRDEVDLYRTQNGDIAPVFALKVGAERTITDYVSIGADLTRLSIFDAKFGADQFPAFDGLLYRDDVEDFSPWAFNLFLRTRF